MSVEDVRIARAAQAIAMRRLADAAIAAAVALDDPGSMPDELDLTHRRVLDRSSAAKQAHKVHAACRAGLLKGRG